jgi:hypothetical protein
MSNLRQEVIDYFKKKGTYDKYLKDGSLERRIKKGIGQIKKARGLDFHPNNLSEKDQEALSNKIIEVAKKHNIEPSKLEQLMMFESGGTLDPTKKSGTSSARGLIQFMPKTLKSLGSSTEEAINMTALEQMELVDQYFTKNLRTDKPTANDVYMSILYPAAVGKDDQYVLFKEGTKEYKANKGLDKNNDGNITKQEAGNSAYNIGAKKQEKRSLLRNVGERQQEKWNQKANEAVEMEKRQSSIPQSPMATLSQSMQPKEEEAKRESLKKMSIAKDIDFGIYS